MIVGSVNDLIFLFEHCHPTSLAVLGLVSKRWFRAARSVFLSKCSAVERDDLRCLWFHANADDDNVVNGGVAPFVAASRGFVHCVRSLLKSRMTFLNWNHVVLHAAARAGHASVVRWVLNCRVNSTRLSATVMANPWSFSNEKWLDFSQETRRPFAMSTTSHLNLSCLSNARADAWMFELFSPQTAVCRAARSGNLATLRVAYETLYVRMAMTQVQVPTLHCGVLLVQNSSALPPPVQVLHYEDCIGKGALEVAVGAGHLDMARWLLALPGSVFYDERQQRPRTTTTFLQRDDDPGYFSWLRLVRRCVNTAASRGRVDVLRFLFEEFDVEDTIFTLDVTLPPNTNPRAVYDSFRQTMAFVETASWRHLFLFSVSSGSDACFEFVRSRYEAVLCRRRRASSPSDLFSLIPKTEWVVAACEACASGHETFALEFIDRFFVYRPFFASDDDDDDNADDNAEKNEKVLLDVPIAAMLFMEAANKGHFSLARALCERFVVFPPNNNDDSTTATAVVDDIVLAYWKNNVLPVALGSIVWLSNAPSGSLTENNEVAVEAFSFLIEHFGHRTIVDALRSPSAPETIVPTLFRDAVARRLVAVVRWLLEHRAEFNDSNDNIQGNGISNADVESALITLCSRDTPSTFVSGKHDAQSSSIVGVLLEHAKDSLSRTKIFPLPVVHENQRSAVITALPTLPQKKMSPKKPTLGGTENETVLPIDEIVRRCIWSVHPSSTAITTEKKRLVPANQLLSPFELACSTNHLGVVRLFCTVFVPSKSEIGRGFAFACLRDARSVVEFLAKYAELTERDILAVENGVAVRLAASAMNFDLTRWMLELGRDQRTNGNTANIVVSSKRKRSAGDQTDDDEFSCTIVVKRACMPVLRSVKCSRKLY
jgi:hypothetical protein